MTRAPRWPFEPFPRGLHRRIFLTCAAASTAMIIAVSLLAAQMVARHARAQLSDNLDMLARHVAATFDQYILEQKHILMTISTSRHLLSVTRGQFASERMRYQAYHDYDDMTASIIANKPYSQLFLWLPEGRELRSTEPRSSTSELDAAQLPWLSQLSALGGMQLITDFTAPRSPLTDTCFAIALPLGELTAFAAADDVLAITTSSRYFDDLSRELLSGGLARFELSANDRALYMLADEGASGAAPSASWHEAVSAQTGWTLGFLAREDPTLAATRGVNWVIFGGAAAAVLLMLLVSQAIAASISRPMRQLTALLDSMSRGELGVRAGDAGDDEIGDALRGFNTMAERMSTLIYQVNRGELLWRETEIYALQQQINPHFLYNTLEGINALANRGDTRAIRSVVQKLAGLFRYATQRKHNKLVPIESELRYGRDYLDIQRYRFSGTIDARFEVDPALEGAHTLPFVLQPLLENAVVHGFLPGQRRDCAIIVSIRLEDGRVVWRVKDNGQGLREDKRLSLRMMLDAPLEPDAQPRESASIGLGNVAMRIRLRWGEAYGVAIDSPPEGGTQVTIVHPFCEGEGETE